MRTNESAYDEGLRQYGNGYGINDNPHRAGTPEWREWIDGWIDARDAAKSARIHPAAARQESGPDRAGDGPQVEAGKRDVA